MAEGSFHQSIRPFFMHTGVRRKNVGGADGRPARRAGEINLPYSMDAFCGFRYSEGKGVKLCSILQSAMTRHICWSC